MPYRATRFFIPTCRLLRSALAVLALLLAMAAPMLAQTQEGASPEQLWNALQDGGYMVLMRHATAPGVGDPDDFTLGDCSTQRLLSAEGRRQAAAVGEAFRRRDIPVDRVYASQWCRTMETATLLELAEAKGLPMLNSFFTTPETADRQTRELAEFVSRKPDDGNVVLVSHQVNIQALTGRFLNQGEVIVLAPQGDDFRILGTMQPAP